MTFLVFCLREDGAIDRLSLSRYAIDSEGFFERVWNQEQEGQWEALRRVVEERKPSNSGLNISNSFAYADGLTHGLYTQMREVLGDEWMKKTTSAERLCVEWLEQRIDDELIVYPGLVEMTHAIIEEGSSNRVIQPGITKKLKM